MNFFVMHNLLFDIIIEVPALEILKQYSTFELWQNTLFTVHVKAAALLEYVVLKVPVIDHFAAGSENFNLDSDADSNDENTAQK